MHVAREIESLSCTERALATSLRLVAARHASDSEVRDTARLLAGWSDDHAERLRRLRERFGSASPRDARRVARGLFRGVRIAGLGLLRDLEDLAVLATRALVGWTALGQAAKALRDQDLEALCVDASATTKRQVAWIETHIKHVAPQALVVKADTLSQLRASLPPIRPAALVAAALTAPLLGAALVGAARRPRAALALALLAAIGVRLRAGAPGDRGARAAGRNESGGLPSLQPEVARRYG